MPRTTGVEVVALRPARVTIVLERTTSKEVPVNPALGEPPAGYEIYSWSVFPRTVVITGPRTQVDRVREVQTERVPLENAREPFRTWVQLNIADPDLHSNQAGPLEVGVDLGPRRTTHTVAQIPVVIDDETLTVAPPRISVTILAPAVLADALKPEDFVAIVPAQAIEPSAESARIKPNVTLKEPRGQLVVIKTVPEVVVRRAKPDADNRRRATVK
jgi:hypothetical protein